MYFSPQKARNAMSSSNSLSAAFKGTSREKKAHWGNRFVRDHNDLLYEANPESISNRIKSNAKKTNNIRVNKQDLPPAESQFTVFKPRATLPSHSTSNFRDIISEGKGLQLSHYLKGVHSFEEKVREGLSTAPQSAKKLWGEGENQYGLKTLQQVEEKKGNEGQNLFGLSRFEYKTTIKGKMVAKSNHHIDFQKNKTRKIDNRNRIWYAEGEELKKEENISHSKQHKIHPFQSYSSHQLFFRSKRLSEDNGCGYGGMLDKFYETMSPEHHRAIHQNTLQKKVDYAKMTPRPALEKKLGTNLNYNTQSLKTLGLGDGRRPLMSMSSSKRTLVIGRQVINPGRGCFR